MVLKIVSGGQTGVDRAALDWAIAAGLPHGGWCPRERLAEDGTIAPKYALVETVSRHHVVRTRLNVEASDATLILNRGMLEGGTLKTADFAEALARPYLVVALDAPDLGAEIAWARRWLEKHSPEVLNIAGPRESGQPGIREQAYSFLEALFGEATGNPGAHVLRRPPLGDAGETRGSRAFP